MFPKHKASNDTILVLVDTSQDQHLALDRALATIKSQLDKSVLHLFFCAKEDDFKSAQVARDLIKVVSKEIVEFTTEYCDSRYKYEGVMECARRIIPSLLLLPDYASSLKVRHVPASNGFFKKVTNCPVMILRNGSHIYSEYGLSTERMMVSNAV